MTLRKRIFIIASVVVLLILAISLLLIVWGNRDKTEIIEEPIATTSPIFNQQTTIPNSILNDQSEQPLTVKTPTTEEMEKNAAKQLSKIFIERYATYSTDLPYQNIKDVESMVTENYWKNLSAVINDSFETTNFVGVTTKAISSSFVSWDKTEAVLNVGVVETKDESGEVNKTNKNVIVNVVKIGDDWLVSGFSWE